MSGVNQQSYADRLVSRLKRNRVIAVAVVLATVIGAAASFTDSLSTLYRTGRGLLPAAADPREMVGKWDAGAAWKIVDAVLEVEKLPPMHSDCKDKRQDRREPACDFSHSHIGEYILSYRDRESILLITASSEGPSDCHACAPALSFFEFVKSDRGWKLQDVSLAVVEWGSWGKIEPEPKVYVIGDNKYGVVLEGKYMAQGIIQSGTTIFVRLGDSFRDVFTELTGVDDTGFKGKPRNVWNSEIKIQHGNTGFFDLVVERSGLRDGETFAERELYKFNGRDYASAGLYR